MLGDVDQQLGLEELLEDVLGRHVHQGLLGAGSHPHPSLPAKPDFI